MSRRLVPFVTTLYLCEFAHHRTALPSPHPSLAQPGTPISTALLFARRSYIGAIRTIPHRWASFSARSG